MLPKQEIYFRHRIKQNMKKCPRMVREFQAMLDELTLKQVESEYEFEKRLIELEDRMKYDCKGKVKVEKSLFNN